MVRPAIAPLIEVKRPRRAEQQDLGFARTDALVGVAPRGGSVHLLENDRVRVYETTLAPGESDDLRPRLDAAIFVIDGSDIRIVDEEADGSTRSRTEARAPTTGHWEPGGGRRQLVNAGTTPYRELRVELK